MELAHQIWRPQDSKNLLDRFVFLHGMGGTGALWRPIAALLEDRYAVLAPDQRGHGGSLTPGMPGTPGATHVAGARETPGYTPLDYGRDVIDTMQALAYHPAWLVGHSMGVRTACAAAHLKPEWVKGLVLVDLGFAGVAGGGLGDGLAGFLRLLPMLFPTRDAAREFMRASCPDPSIAQYLMAVSKKTDDGGLTFPFDRSALIQTIEAARDVSVREWVRELGERRKPVLVLRGDASRVWSHGEFEAERERFKAYPSIGFLEVEGATHGLPFEKRAEFAALLVDFASGHASGSLAIPRRK